MAGTSPAMTKESPRAPLRRREPHQLDRVEVLHAAADALGRVEQHVRLGGERVAQHMHALSPLPSTSAAPPASVHRPSSSRGWSGLKFALLRGAKSQRMNAALKRSHAM